MAPRCRAFTGSNPACFVHNENVRYESAPVHRCMGRTRGSAPPWTRRFGIAIKDISAEYQPRGKLPGATGL